MKGQPVALLNPQRKLFSCFLQHVFFGKKDTAIKQKLSNREQYSSI